MIKLYRVDNNDAYSYKPCVFAKTPMEALSFIYPSYVSIDHLVHTSYKVQYLKDSYVFVDVDEVIMKRGVIL